MAFRSRRFGRATAFRSREGASRFGRGRRRLRACSGADPFVEELRRTPPSAGAVVTEHPLATLVGLETLDAGGNAADAAVAAALALAVVYPQAGNLGGGGFAVWVPAEGDPKTIDFRESTPAGYDADLYLDANGDVVPERSLSTPLAVGVPGSPLGLWHLYERFGIKDGGQNLFRFAQLAEGAIQLAEEGFDVDPYLEEILSRRSIRERLTRDPGAAALFYPGGRGLAVGDRLVQPRLASTLRAIAQSGARGFYGGAVAQAIIDDLRDADLRAGFVAGERGMTLEDLGSYRIAFREPVRGTFEGREIISMGPPSSGGIALIQTLGILEGLPLGARRRKALTRIEQGLDGPAEIPAARWSAEEPAPSGIDAQALHWWIEAMRSAFADRAEHLGDPEHHAVPVDQLLSPGWLAERRIAIGDRARPNVAPWTAPPVEGSDETTHISVIDRFGNAVSLTTTLNGSFGSGIYVEEAGILLNNELDDFSIKPGTPNMFGLVGGEANQLGPGRRPLSSMTPTVVRNSSGRVEVVIGAPGGPRIITATTQVLLRLIAYEQDLESALRAPAHPLSSGCRRRRASRRAGRRRS